MSFFVSMLGLVAVVAGIVGFVFGLSIKEFSFGGTLMITGTMALIGGLLLIAIAAAIRELNRLGTILASRQAPRFLRPGEPQDAFGSGFAHTGVTPPRVATIPVPPAPPIPVHDAGAGSSHDEPPRETRFAAVAAAVDMELAREASRREVPKHEASMHEAFMHEATTHEAFTHEAVDAVARALGNTMARDATADEVPEREAPVSAAAVDETAEPAEPGVHEEELPKEELPIAEAAAEPSPVLHDSEDIPLSPHGVSREDSFETYVRTTAREDEPAAEPGTAAEQPEAASIPPAPKLEPKEPPRERGRLSSFDAIWPPSERTPTHRHAGSEREERHGDVRHGKDRDVEAPTSEAPDIAPSQEPDMTWSRDRAIPELSGIEPADIGPSDGKTETPHAVSILKSGVVDGMGYALYSDGSIEAALPTGTVRFASIGALREHLEKAG